MTPADLLTDAFTRIREGASAVVEGLTVDQLAHRPPPGGNPVGWLVWHLCRVQDDHVADVAGLEQVWTAQGYADRFGLPFAPEATGYGQDDDEVDAVRVEAELLAAYACAVSDQTLAFLRTVGPDELDRVVDERWDPPVTLGARLVSVADDDIAHLGQAAYVRGLLGAAG